MLDVGCWIQHAGAAGGVRTGDLHDAVVEKLGLAGVGLHPEKAA
jgi:hypothetical protein